VTDSESGNMPNNRMEQFLRNPRFARIPEKLIRGRYVTITDSRIGVELSWFWRFLWFGHETPHYSGFGRERI
jgi:hypothetical protein